MQPYNTTQLNTDTIMERHVFHRDQFAHYLRWTHVLNRATLNAKILDFGCGSGNLYEVFFRNLKMPERYLGLDVRKQTINKNKEKFPRAEFQTQDLVGDFDFGQDWDFITSFETLEHVGRANISKFLDNILKHCGKDTEVLLSTPCYDPVVGPADNHVINGVIGEFTYDELKIELEGRFTIEAVYGTFCSQKDVKPVLTPAEREVFDKLHDYYDPNLVSVIFAPLHPEQSRNCIWRLKKL